MTPINPREVTSIQSSRASVGFRFACGGAAFLETGNGAEGLVDARCDQLLGHRPPEDALDAADVFVDVGLCLT